MLVLVTGGAGFIGSNICRKLISQGCFVRVIDNLLTGKKSNLSDIIDKIEFIEADMGDENVARKAVKDIDVVLHQGALPSVPKSIDNPAATHKHCVDATFTLLLAARDAGIKRFVYAFTDELRQLKNTTSLLISQVTNEKQLSRDTISEFICDGVINVIYESMGGEFSRSLMIRKMRQVKHDEDIHPLEISKKGLVVHRIK